MVQIKTPKRLKKKSKSKKRKRKRKKIPTRFESESSSNGSSPSRLFSPALRNKSNSRELKKENLMPLSKYVKKPFVSSEEDEKGPKPEVKNLKEQSKKIDISKIQNTVLLSLVFKKSSVKKLFLYLKYGNEALKKKVELPKTTVLKFTV